MRTFLNIIMALGVLIFCGFVACATIIIYGALFKMAWEYLMGG